MPILYVEEFDIGDDRSTSHYDAIFARLEIEADPPKGLVVHTAGFTGDQFRIVDVWETEEDKANFYEGRVMPIVMQIMSEAETQTEPPRMYSYELHDLAVG
jgi:hypothetical protein